MARPATRSVRRSWEPSPIFLGPISTRAGYLLWSLDSDFERIAPALDGLELYRPS